MHQDQPIVGEIGSAQLRQCAYAVKQCQAVILWNVMRAYQSYGLQINNTWASRWTSDEGSSDSFARLLLLTSRCSIVPRLRKSGKTLRPFLCRSNFMVFSAIKLATQEHACTVAGLRLRRDVLYRARYSA